MAEIDEMAPAASPGTVRTGVRRVNRVPLYILGGVVGSFLLVMMMVAADRSAQQNAPVEAEKEIAGKTAMFADSITAGHTDGIIAPAAPPEIPADVSVAPDQTAPITGPAQASNAGTVDSTAMNTAVNPTTVTAANPQLDLPDDLQSDDEENAKRLRRVKQQMFENAVRAKTNVPVSTAGGSIASSGGPAAPALPAGSSVAARLAAVRRQLASLRSVDPSAAYQAKLAQIRQQTKTGGGNTLGGAGAPAPTRLAANDVDTDGDTGQFGGSTDKNRFTLNASIESPASPFELRTGFVVPATMISGINSDLAGQIVGQVAQNVYDTATGRYLLIPQGARLVGTYKSDVAIGQSRVLVAWQRIIFPDGKTLDIDTMPGADSAGFAGFKDQVNNHYVRLFGSAFLMSGITAGVSLSQDRASTGSDRISTSQTLSQSLGTQLGQVAAQLIAANLNISPTLEIRPGFRFNVIVTKDMVFPTPYRAFDY